MTKTVHVHLGPHRTGSGAVAFCLHAHKQILHTMGLTYLDAATFDPVAKALDGDDPETLTAGMRNLIATCVAAEGDVILSSPELLGHLPGSTQKRRIYPQMIRNLAAFEDAFADTSMTLRYYFFVRDPDNWTASVYVRLLQDTSRFAALDRLRNFLHDGDLWAQTLRKPRARLSDRFHEIPYPEQADFSAPNALLKAVLGSEPATDLTDTRHNAAPSFEQITLLEAVNRSGASEAARQQARDVFIAPPRTAIPDAGRNTFPVWPRDAQRPDWLLPGLNALWRRVGMRVHRQDQPNLMPDLTEDLIPYRHRPVTASDDFPEGGRAQMENQVQILAFRFRGLPETCFLMALAISYLRRNTDHTAHAAALFQRLWAEEHAVLLGTLPTRWLISAFQTFLDHGANEAQRILGASAYFLSNTLKAYEAERAMEGLPADATYPNTVPVTKSGYPGLDRFKLGGTDLMLNTNALLLELATQDAVAGRVVQEFMLRTKAGHSMFTRMDRSRAAHDIEIPQFSNCWSFYEKPKE